MQLPSYSQDCTPVDRGHTTTDPSGTGDGPPIDRRTFLASAGSLAGASAVSGCSFFQREADSETTTLPEDRARDLAAQFAPTLYFDTAEQWFPTDPRPYEREQDGTTVVDGFAALQEYTTESKESDGPPAPTLFYHAVRYDDSPLAVVQFWYYAAFDQFTTNFHWHDWEVLHVFVDTDSGEPQLYVASSHSGSVPNNEFLDPEPGQRPRILSELGSHSSALSLNADADRFQRLPLSDTLADITNSPIDGIPTFANIPVAYGLPRGEGWRLPYIVPELDGAPVYEDDRLAAVDRSDLLPEELTVSAFADLLSPPDTLRERETGLVFAYREHDTDASVAYDLVPSRELEHIADFTGPQLGFEFAIPAFAENLVASHITTTGVPWQQSRYERPAADISDPNHRQALADRYDAIGDPAPVNTIVAGVTEAVTADEAPADEGLTTEPTSVESVVLVESAAEAVPTSGGLAVVQGVPAGDHRFTVNGAGVEPHSETVEVADESTRPTVAGVDGEVPVVAREQATKLEVDADGTDDDLRSLAVEDDFAGRLYDAPLAGPDAVYVHRGGAFTAEVRDSEDEIGAFRLNPTDETRLRIDEPRTGKGSLATYTAAVAAETAAAVAAVGAGGSPGTGSTGNTDGAANAVNGLARALEAVAEAAQRAADRAAAGDQERADRSLVTVRERLGRLTARLADARDGLPDDLERAVEHRTEQLDRRSTQAQAARTL